MSETPCQATQDIDDCVEIIHSFSARGWVLGTGGNFSVVLTREPFRLAITSSEIDKSAISAKHFLHLDAPGNVLEGEGRPTAEAGLHRAVLESVNARAVFHTHSVWATVLSTTHASRDGLYIEGYEMLKGLQGVDSHTHREWLPIIENSQDIPTLSDAIRHLLAEKPKSHGFLIRGHGLYTWGKTIQDAKRHVEI
ncbi:MAG TPA: methylthioribulose 1-phosphate dehydratase, partial [Nitrospirales bacterium]|nr:methylthioribulose 1-phosphate dehydratase [Nitrospirales bacterium]